jgi:hypothetical protein
VSMFELRAIYYLRQMDQRFSDERAALITNFYPIDSHDPIESAFVNKDTRNRGMVPLLDL